MTTFTARDRMYAEDAQHLRNYGRDCAEAATEYGVRQASLDAYNWCTGYLAALEAIGAISTSECKEKRDKVLHAYIDCIRESVPEIEP